MLLSNSTLGQTNLMLTVASLMLTHVYAREKVCYKAGSVEQNRHQMYDSTTHKRKWPTRSEALCSSPAPQPSKLSELSTDLRWASRIAKKFIPLVGCWCALLEGWTVGQRIAKRFIHFVVLVARCVANCLCKVLLLKQILETIACETSRAGQPRAVMLLNSNVSFAAWLDHGPSEQFGRDADTKHACACVSPSSSAT